MDNLASVPVTMATVKAGFAAGTTTTVSTTATVQFCIKGKAYSKTAITNGASPTTDYNTGVAFLPVAAGYGSIFVIGFDSGGNQKVMQGSIVPLNQAGAFINAPQFPDIPNDVCPFGYLVIKAGSTTVAPGWVYGASEMASVTGITYTFVDILGMPDRPQIA